MSVCPSCSCQNRDEARFCRQCGQLLAPPDPYSRYLSVMRGRLTELMTFPGWGDVRALDKIDISREIRDKRYFSGAHKTTFLDHVQLAAYPVRLFAEQYAHTPGKPYAHWFNRVYLVCEETRGDFDTPLIGLLQTESIGAGRLARDAFLLQHATSTVVSVTLAMVSQCPIDRYRRLIEDFFFEPPDDESATCSYEVLNVMVSLDPPLALATTHRSHPWHGPGLQKFFQPA
jgi:hypothetical protein